MITVDSPERVLEAPSTVGDASQHSSRKACSALEDETLAEELPRVEEVPVEASLAESIGAPPPRARRASLEVLGAQRPPDRLVPNSYVEPMDWARPTEDAPAPDQEIARAFINYWKPFNQRDPPIVHMSDLYPHSFRLPVVAHGEEYSIPGINLDKRSNQRVAEDGMYICNHDFDETTELAWSNL